MLKPVIVIDHQEGIMVSRTVNPNPPPYSPPITRPADMTRKPNQFIDPGYGPTNKGATGNNGKKGANSRATKDTPKAAVPDNGEVYNASKDKALKSDAEWSKVADGYDWSCGMQPKEEWEREFLKLMHDDATHYNVKDWGVLGEKYQAWYGNAKLLPATTAKPVDRRECFKCHKELTATTPAFRWAFDGNLYCGSCYNTLPPSVKPVTVKPIEVKPVKVEPLIKELRTMQAILPQALQDRQEVEPLAPKAKVDLKRLTPAELHCRNLATSQAHWDRMYLAQVEWHRECSGGLVGAAERERRMRRPDPEPSAPASLPIAA